MRDISIHKGDLVNKTVPFSTLDLKISDFTFNINLNEDLYYEERLLRNNYQITDEDSLKSFFEEREIGQNVNEILQTENRIVILGNPGIGKTVELNHLFIYFWKEKEKKGIIPFYLNIKNFTDNTDIENLINFPNWRLIENPCFIIDGLDEISNLNNFISKLELFLTYNKKVKIILSCRTNIYEKFMINISESKHYFLEP
jgi:predicted NACHT family NTPase